MASTIRKIQKFISFCHWEWTRFFSVFFVFPFQSLSIKNVRSSIGTSKFFRKRFNVYEIWFFFLFFRLFVDLLRVCAHIRFSLFVSMCLCWCSLTFGFVRLDYWQLNFIEKIAPPNRNYVSLVLILVGKFEMNKSWWICKQILNNFRDASWF